MVSQSKQATVEIINHVLIHSAPLERVKIIRRSVSGLVAAAEPIVYLLHTVPKQELSSPFDLILISVVFF